MNFRGDCRPYTWLYGIMRRVCFSFLRQARRRLLFRQQTPGWDEAPPPAPLAHGHYQHLAVALEHLPQHQFEIISLRFYEEMKLAEIAGLLGLPEGTVKSRLHHALAGLRQVLQEVPQQTRVKKEESHALP